RTDGTVAIRAVRPGAGTSPRADGTMTIRAVPQQGTAQGTAQQSEPQQPPSPAQTPSLAQTPAQTPSRAQPPAQQQGPAQAQPPVQQQGPAQAQPPVQQQGPAQAQAPAQQQRPVQAQAQAPAQPRPAPSAPAPNQPGYGYPQPAAQPTPAPAPTTAPNPSRPGYGYPQPAQPAQPAYGYPQSAQPATPAVSTPVTQGPGGGSPSWAQQVHQLASPQQAAEPEGPVTPFKPVAEDPFLAAAQAQASARPAGLGKRFVARLIDTLVLGAVTAAVAVPLGTRAFDHIDGKIDAAKASGRQVTVWLLDGTTATYLGIVLAVLLLFGVLYEALPTAKWGHTLGKKLMGLSVREIEGSDSPTFGAALRRWLAYAVLLVLGIGVLGVLWGAIDRPWRQCLHDKVARTFVAG
ncbi:RDD family protein, partial [Streptomyces kunmingensis]